MRAWTGLAVLGGANRGVPVKTLLTAITMAARCVMSTSLQRCGVYGKCQDIFKLIN